MAEEKKEESSKDIGHKENKEKQLGGTEELIERTPYNVVETDQTKDIEKLEKELSELKDKYLRLYADFENYKRLVAKEREELIKYSNEGLIRELLSVIDHLELALQHSSDNEVSSALAEGVNMTLRELKTVLEKFGLVNIEAIGKPFDPFIHHAMSQIESEKDDENAVIAEFRKGYMLRDRVLRAALVGVSKKKVNSDSE